MLPEPAPELSRLLPELGPQAEMVESMPSGDSLSQARLFEQILRFLVELAIERPVVFVVEDLHWADRSTRDFLSFLIHNAGAASLLVICTYRGDELRRRHPLRPFLSQHARTPTVEQLELQPFTEGELRAQLEAILGRPPGREAVRRLFERSEGNAFFAEELLAASVEGETDLPQTVRDALLVRTEAVSLASQEVLRVAAAAGRLVTHELLTAVADHPEPQLTEELREAVAHQLLLHRKDREAYEFRHALLRESIYLDLLPGERTRIHTALAEMLTANPQLAADPEGNPAAELAFHWRAAQKLDQALASSVEAGESAEETYAYAEANRHFENALELWEGVEDAETRARMDEPDLLLRAAENAGRAGRGHRAVGLARRAADLLPPERSPVRAALALERLGEYLWFLGDSDVALDAYRRAVRLLPRDRPSVELARVLGAEGRILMLRGSGAEARVCCEEALALAREIGAPAQEAHVLNTLGAVMPMLGDFEAGIGYVREGMRIAKELQAPLDIADAYINLADDLDGSGRVEEGAEVALEGVEVTRALGLHRETTFIIGELAPRLVRLGRLDQAEELVSAEPEIRQEGLPVALLHAAGAEIDLHRGRLDEGSRKLARAIEASGGTGDSQIVSMLAALSARLEVLRGEPDRAALVVDQAFERMDTREVVFESAAIYGLANRAHADRAARAREIGDVRAVAEAERSAVALLDRLERLLDPERWLVVPPPEAVAHASQAAAELERLRGPAVAATWSEVADRWDALGLPLEAAYARWRQAEALLAQGEDRREAKRLLVEAAALTSDAGASFLGAQIGALARRARIDLDVDGSLKPDAPRSPGPDLFGLTDRELSVLELVADGRTNREIGEKLFISRKTASAHVSHILSKLDVRSRVEAATAANRLGLIPLPEPTREPSDPGD